MKLFGFEITRSKGDQKKQETLVSFVPEKTEDDSIYTAVGGAYGTFLDLDGKARSENELINRYRDLSLQPECEQAIDEIVNSSVVYDEQGPPVEIVLDNIQYSDTVKEKIRKEFDGILRMLDFSNMGWDMFKRWYVDGRIYFHLVIDRDHPEDGIQELRYIDPRRIKKVRELLKNGQSGQNRTFQQAESLIHSNMKFRSYYVYIPPPVVSYGPNSSENPIPTQGLQIATDSVAYVHSGIFNREGNMVLSHLNKAIKFANNLRMYEDAKIIYAVTRAPERRVFYIDVGSLPNAKAEQYLTSIMNKYKNKVVYDASTGEIKDERKFQTMLEDFWLPRREGGRGTEIDVLQGGNGLGDVSELEYFQKKLYRSLNVPISRLEPETGFNLGRSSEITRDEVNFQKFINRLRNRFSILFDIILSRQLILKGIVNNEEWKMIQDSINYDWIEDTMFSELKEIEILRERLSLLTEVEQYKGIYFSQDRIQKQILRMTEDEIIEEKKKMDEERAAGLYQQQMMEKNPELFQDDEGGGGGGFGGSPSPAPKPKPPSNAPSDGSSTQKQPPKPPLGIPSVGPSK